MHSDCGNATLYLIARCFFPYYAPECIANCLHIKTIAKQSIRRWKLTFLHVENYLRYSEIIAVGDLFKKILHFFLWFCENFDFCAGINIEWNIITLQCFTRIVWSDHLDNTVFCPFYNGLRYPANDVFPNMSIPLEDFTEILHLIQMK